MTLSCSMLLLKCVVFKGIFDRTELSVFQFPPGMYNFTLTVEVDGRLTVVQLPISLSGQYI